MCGAAAFPASGVFDLREVTVAGNAAVPTDEILRRAAVGPGVGVFRVNAQAIRERLLEDPRIEDADVTLAFPHRLRLVVRERTPVAALGAGEGYVLLSADGVAIAPSAGPGALPVIAVDRLDPAGISVGTVLPSADARLAARVVGTLPQPLRDRVAGVDVDRAGEVVLVLRDRVLVRLGDRRGIAERVEMLPQVLDAITARGLRVESVDLRFPGNVVVRPVRASGGPVRAGERQENPPPRGIQPAMHRPSVP